MKEVLIVIAKLTDIRKLNMKACSASGREKILFLEARHELCGLKFLLEQEQVREAVDSTLAQIMQNKDNFKNSEEAQSILKNLPMEFISFEMQQYEYHKIKRRDMRTYLEEARRETIKHNEKCMQGIYSVFPTNSDELFDLMRLQMEVLESQIQEARSMSRQNKKDRKASAWGRFWLGTVGTTLAMGNVAASAASLGIATPVALASIGAGVCSLGSAVFNDPGVFKYMGKLANKQEGT